MTVKKNKSTSTIVLFSSGISRLKFEDEGRIGGIRKKPPLLGSRDRFGRDVWPKKKPGDLELLNSILNMYCMLVFYVSWLWYKKGVPLWTHISDNVWYHIIRLLVFIMLTDTSLRAMINLATNHEVFPLDRRLNQWTIDVFWSMWMGIEHTPLPRPMIWVKLSVNLNQLSFMELTWLRGG